MGRVKNPRVVRVLQCGHIILKRRTKLAGASYICTSHHPSTLYGYILLFTTKANHGVSRSSSSGSTHMLDSSKARSRSGS